MQFLARAFYNFLLDRVRDALARNQDASIRILLEGPPVDALEELFVLLSSNGSSDWSIDLQGITITIPVLLVSDSGNLLQSGVISSRCRWDYCVTVRNTTNRYIILVAPSVSDRIPESLVNTTEVIGTLRGKLSRRWLDTPLWKYLVREISSVLGLPSDKVMFALREVAKQSTNLSAGIRNRAIWGATNELLQGASTISPVDMLALASGFPAIGSSGGELDNASNVLKALAALVGSDGITGALELIRNTQAIQSRALVQDVDVLRQYLISNAPSGATFEEVPSFYYKPPFQLPPPAWWSQLNQGVLMEALQELEPATPEKLSVSCDNRLGVAKEVSIVANAVELTATAVRRAPPNAVNFSRRIGRGGGAVLIAADPQNFARATDASPPTHDRPLSYRASAAGFNDGTSRVISLDSFTCRGLVIVTDADDNPIPSQTRGQANWLQQIVLARSGNSEVRALHCRGVSSMEITRTDNNDPPIVINVQPTDYETRFVLDIEDDSQYIIRMLDGSNQLAQWSTHFLVQESGESPPNRFAALVKKHQRKGKLAPARALESPLRKLEQAYLQSADSWKPVLACWPTNEIGDLQLYWSDPRLGSAFPQLDPRPRPALVPPTEVIQAREAVRLYLEGKRRPIGEIPFDDSNMGVLTERYLSAYDQWLRSGEPDVTWFDVIAVYAAEKNEQVGGYLSYAEPSAILLSPLHPLRVAWHHSAQRVLEEALARPCPAAALLDPATCPDSGLWFLRQGSEARTARAFFSVACEEPHWSVLLNRNYIGQSQVDLALQRLAALGLKTRGLPGGFSISQAFDSVQEVVKLLPGRSILRIGLVGDQDNTSACAKGVFTWCSDNFSEEEESITPSAVEVFDMRKSNEPTAEQLATLAEETSERVRWFKVLQLPDRPQDLVLLDQLGIDSPGGETGDARTPTGPGALVRIRMREDSRNAMQLKESRIGQEQSESSDLLARISNLCIAFEERSIQDNEVSQFTFRPVQQAIGSRLAQAIYVAVTSTQIDPACIIRGTRGQQGYLWDYELPGALSGDDERAGYYLIAAPMEAMLRAISQSAQLVATTPPPVSDLLDEISRRGIPILKRLAAGGSQSRGELGLLLAVRYLQDSFRPSAARSGLPVWLGRCIHLILAVDPYETTFDGLRKALRLQTSEQRPDLLVFAIRLPTGDEQVRIKITPVEIKFRQGQMPGAEIRAALSQASNLATLLNEIWVRDLPEELWKICCSGLLGQMLEFAFRIYADSNIHGKTVGDWTRAQQIVIDAVLSCKAEITVNAAGRLLVFDQRQQSAILDSDADNRPDTAVIFPGDASILLTGSGALSLQAEQGIRSLDFSFPDCENAAGQANVSPSGDESGTGISGSSLDSTQISEIQAGSDSEIRDAAAAGSNIEPPTSPTSSPVPPEIRHAVTEAFQGFIGNDSAVRRLKNDLLRALIERPPHLSKNFLFTGQPSTGKTEISRRMSSALRLPFVKLDGRGLRSRERLFELIDGELIGQGLNPSQSGTQAGLPIYTYPPLIVFIDEVHLVPRAIQESLLTMLEAADRSLTLPDRVAIMNQATFLFATTRASDLDAAFRSRCSEVQLREYNREQVAEIVRLHFPHGWPTNVYLTIAQLGRRVPRIALELAKELETAIAVTEDSNLTVEMHLDIVRQSRELDNLGLTSTDLEYLSLLARENRPVGEQMIINILGTVDRDRVIDEIEPFLRSLGFVRFGPRGREITEEGRDYLTERTRQ